MKPFRACRTPVHQMACSRLSGERRVLTLKRTWQGR